MRYHQRAGRRPRNPPRYVLLNLVGQSFVSTENHDVSIEHQWKSHHVMIIHINFVSETVYSPELWSTPSSSTQPPRNTGILSEGSPESQVTDCRPTDPPLRACPARCPCRARRAPCRRGRAPQRWGQSPSQRASGATSAPRTGGCGPPR